MNLMTGREEFYALKDKLCGGVHDLVDANPDDSSLNFWSGRMLDAISAARSLDTLRVYEKFMLVEKNARVFHWFQMAVTYMSQACDGPIAHIFTQEHVDRLIGFDRAMFLTNNGMFPDAKDYEEYREYLNAIQAAAVISDADAYEYLTANLIAVSILVMERDIIDPKLITEMLKVMASGSAALVAGTL